MVTSTRCTMVEIMADRFVFIHRRSIQNKTVINQNYEEDIEEVRSRVCYRSGLSLSFPALPTPIINSPAPIQYSDVCGSNTTGDIPLPLTCAAFDHINPMETMNLDLFHASTKI